jgi:hypothetical protein
MGAMRLLETSLGPSPLDSNSVRLQAAIEVESRAHVLHYWFDFPATLKDEIAFSGDAAATLMLPLACFFGETLILDQPVDRKLLENLRGLQQLWKSWFPDLTRVEIVASSVTPARPSYPRTHPAKRTIACLSGGVDSLFTFLRHDKTVQGDGSALIDDFLCVGGLNTDLDDFPDLVADLGDFSRKVGRRFVPILTNLRYCDLGLATCYSIGPWLDRVFATAVMASIVHMMSGRYEEFLVPSSLHYGTLMPWSQHPMTDRLLSSSGLRVIHDGATVTRFQRTALVAQSDDALEILQVCGQNRRHKNCSRCQKCLRTMAALDILGAIPRAKTFNWSVYSVDKIADLWMRQDNQLVFIADLIEEAKAYGRDDISRAAYASVSYSRRKRAVLNFIESNPLTLTVWRIIRALRQGLRSALHWHPA